MRVGLGFDVHPFSDDPTRRLVLGGVHLPGERGLAGHSDADVVLHAITDALLGAAAAGDIGGHFPDTDARWKDASSIGLLRQIVELVRHGRMEVIPSVLPPGTRDQLPIIFDTMRQVFVLSIHETFYLGALICFVALGLSFLNGHALVEAHVLEVERHVVGPLVRRRDPVRDRVLRAGGRDGPRGAADARRAHRRADKRHEHRDQAKEDRQSGVGAKTLDRHQWTRMRRHQAMARRQTRH